MHVLVIVELVDLGQEFHLGDRVGVTDVLGLDTDIGGRLDFHADVDVGVFAVAHLDDSKAGREAREFRLEFGDFFFEAIADLSTEEFA